MSVSLVARQQGIAPNQLLTWRRLYASVALSAMGAGEEVVVASEYRALQHRVRKLRRVLGKDLGEPNPARGAGSGAAVQQKNGCCARPRRRGTARRKEAR